MDDLADKVSRGVHRVVVFFCRGHGVFFRFYPARKAAALDPIEPAFRSTNGVGRVAIALAPPCTPCASHVGSLAVHQQGATYMAHDIDRPDDSTASQHANSVAEETSATGQRVKGAIKEEVGDMLDDEEMEDKGARENEAGKDRQKKNDAV
jgi:uncharacterized protein YjbJ (UPF0337 family)